MESTTRGTTQKSFNRKYRRLDKPPYTYVAMTTLAIQENYFLKLTTCELQEFFKKKFVFIFLENK